MTAAKRAKIVILASGGIDSSTMLLLYPQSAFELFPIFVDYGQLSAEREYNALLKILKHLGITSSVTKLSVQDAGKITDSQLTNIKTLSPYHPHRNLLLLTLGAMYAHKIKSMALAIGIVGGHSAPFPDSTRAFIQSAQRVLSTSIRDTIRIYTPLFDFMKSEVIRYGVSTGFKYSLTYSCYSGKKVHCGSCQGCRERQLAFKDAHLKDELKYGSGKKNPRRRKIT
jgi:7-cyano-7-deazaguanine synthase